MCGSLCESELAVQLRMTFELLPVLPLPPKGWDYRNTSSYLALTFNFEIITYSQNVAKIPATVLPPQQLRQRLQGVWLCGFAPL